VSDRRPVDPDPISVSELQEPLASEIGPIVYDDGFGHTEPVDNVKEELDGLLGVGFGDGFRLDPLGELVHRDKPMSETTRGLLERLDHVETRDRERLGEGDGLKRLHYQVGLPSIELTPLARADSFLRVVQCCRLVETLAKSFADQRPRGRVVPTDASVDLQEEFLSLLGRDAFHEHSYLQRAVFVKFPVDGNKHLGASSNPLCLGSISWEDRVEEVRQERRPPVGVVYRCVSCWSRNLHRNAVRAPEPFVGGRLAGRHWTGALGHRVGRPLR
jgi:hypothetical protein